MKVTKITRNSDFINVLALNYTSINAKAHVEDYGYSKDKRFRNILLTNIEFTFMNKTYVLDHVWIQKRDMKDGDLFDHIGQDIEIICNFYQYRNDITRHACGLTVYRHRLAR